MKMKIFPCIIFCFLSIQILGQSTDVLKKIQLANNLFYCQSLGATSDSCLLIGGMESFNLPGSTAWSAVVSKINKNGQPIWTKKYSHFESEGITQLIETVWGDYIIVSFSNSFNTNMGVLRCISSSGAFKWKTQFTLVFTDDIYVSSFSDSTLIVSYKGYSGNATQSQFLYKVNTNGVIKWSKGYKDTLNSNIAFQKMVQSNSNNIYLGGYHVPYQPPRLLLAKADTSGNILWTKSIMNSDTTKGIFFSDFIVTPNNEIYMASFQSGFLLGIIKADSSGNIIKSKMFLSYKKRLLDTSIKQRTINEDLIVSGGYYDSISNNRGYYIFRLDSGLNQLSGFTFYSDSITSATRLHLELFADDKLAFCANEYLVQHFYRLALLLLQNSNLNVSQLCNIAPLILSSTTIVLPSSDIELNDTLITSYPIYSFYNSTTVPDTLIDSTLCLITGIEENAVHENKFVSVSPNPSYDILIIKIQKNSPGKTAFILRNATSEILINEETELNGSFSKTLNIQTIPSGIYFLEVTSKFFKEQFKIVKL